MPRYIGVIGERICGDENRQIAERVGRRIAENGGVLLCGGMGGVMEAASYGARNADGVVLAVLPGLSRDEGNPYLTFSIITGMGEGRNLILVRSCDALIAIGGGYGTLSEIAFAHKLGIPVVGIHTWHLSRGGKTDTKIVQVSDPEQAVRRAFEMAQGRRQESGVRRQEKVERTKAEDRGRGSGIRSKEKGKRQKVKG
jgi:hypothetical protein